MTISSLKAYPSTSNHLFPSPARKPEWPVSLEAQLYRWLRTQAFRAVNSGFDFSPRDDGYDEYTVEEISLGMHLVDLAEAEADLPAVVERTYNSPVEGDWDDLLADGFVETTTVLAPAVHRSGVRFISDHATRRDQNRGYFSYDHLVASSLRVARFVIEAHDPERAALLAAAAKKGGQHRLYTVDMLDGLKQGVRTNPWRLARELGCSEQVARKLIKEDEARA